MEKLTAYQGKELNNMGITNSDNKYTNFSQVAVGSTALNGKIKVNGQIQNNGSVDMVASAAVSENIQSVELNHATVLVAAVIADASDHQGLLIVKNTSSGGTVAHTLTLTVGTFNGTNNVATLNAPNEALVVFIDSAGNGTIVENVGAVVLS
jgi:hypothetical protein